jgi:hypothetical protein
MAKRRGDAQGRIAMVNGVAVEGLAAGRRRRARPARSRLGSRVQLWMGSERRRWLVGCLRALGPVRRGLSSGMVTWRSRRRRRLRTWGPEEGRARSVYRYWQAPDNRTTGRTRAVDTVGRRCRLRDELKPVARPVKSEEPAIDAHDPTSDESTPAGLGSVLGDRRRGRDGPLARL